MRAPLLAAWLTDPRRVPDVRAWTERIVAAERAGLDFAVVDAAPLDTLLVAARLATATSRIGIVAAAPTTVTEPFHVSTEVATIDFVSRGRIGWLATTTPAAAAAPEVTWEVPDDVEADAIEHVTAVRALWDSWEEGAEIRDAATARFVDAGRIHHVDFHGAHVSVRGPSITPRPPQGQPVVFARAGDARLAEHADVVLDGERFRGGAILPPGADLAAVRRDPAPGATLRERLGLPAAANRYAAPAR